MLRGGENVMHTLLMIQSLRSLEMIYGYSIIKTYIKKGLLKMCRTVT